MGGPIGDVVNLGVRSSADVLTGGLAESGGWSSKLGKMAGGIASGNPFGALNPNAPVPSAGQLSPLQQLQMSGGAPLLANIALGADVYDSMASFLGVPKEEIVNSVAGFGGGSTLGNSPFSRAEQLQLKSLADQLHSVQNDTTVKTQAVQKLVNDFPNYMASAIPKYTEIMDAATQKAAQAALDQVSAKYAAGGMLSSGAEAEAMARTAASTEQGNLQLGTSLAGADWQNQFNSANALLNFQQKMLGQGATQGFNAVQNALNANTGNARQSAGFQNDQNVADQNRQNAMFGALGSLGGTVIGSSLFGPIGGMAGGQVGKATFSGAPSLTTIPRSNDASVGMNA